jgi:hypothetical protein
MFAAIDCQFRATEELEPLAITWGRERPIWTPDVEEPVMDCIENPGVSMRQIAAELNAVHCKLVSDYPQLSWDL